MFRKIVKNVGVEIALAHRAPIRLVVKSRAQAIQKKCVAVTAVILSIKYRN